MARAEEARGLRDEANVGPDPRRAHELRPLKDLRWKVACGLPIDHGGFHPTTLTVWRHRLRASQRPERIFEAVRAVIAETGVLRGKHRRALDSVVLDDAVATQDTVTQLIAAVRRVRRQVPEAAAIISPSALS